MSWEDEIRAAEEEARSAFLQKDIEKLTALWTDDFAVNNPMGKVLTRAQIFGALQSGRLGHTSYELEIERMTRHGDTVVVMGNDRVTDPPDGAVTLRRFTNVWQHDGTTWRSIARQASVIRPSSP